jgi:hypothetical protein
MRLAKPCIVLTTRQALARLASVGRIRRKADELERIRRKQDKIRRKYAELEAEGWRKHFQPISIQYRVLSALGDDCLTSKELAAVSMIPQGKAMAQEKKKTDFIEMPGGCFMA